MESLSEFNVHHRIAKKKSGLEDKVHILGSLLGDADAKVCECLALDELVKKPVSQSEEASLSRALDALIGAVKGKAAKPSRKASSRANHSKEKMLEAAAFSHMGDGMIIIDSEERIYVLNDRAKEMLGYEPSERVHGLKYKNRFLLQDREGNPIPDEKDPVKRAFSTGERVRVTLMDDVYCARRGSLSFPVSMSVAPFAYNKKVRGTVVVFEDITQEKKVDEVKSDFIYIASHQLRTPLTVSTLHTEMLLAGHGGEINKDQKEFLQEILFYNKKMAQLLSVFMTVSKIELGTFVMQEKPTDLRLVMDDVLHELASNAKNKSLAITTEYDESVPLASTDPEFIRIVFQNLVSNAVKYTPHNGTIGISIKKKGGDAIIAIADSGCGIPAAEQDQVFNKLYRGTNTKGHRWDSNGLGLYIAKSIVDKCGGGISFKSKENEGTTFEVSLPLHAERVEQYGLEEAAA